MRLKVGMQVMIRSTCSLRFAGRWGRITRIDSNNQLPIRIVFKGKEYGFVEDELLTENEIDLWEQQKIQVCSYCGKDIKGLYTYICEDCMYPLPDEGGY